MSKAKQLSNPFSTGGGGANFEQHVQASYVVLMLSGGFAPCLPCWPIVKVKLQARVDGYENDDLVLVVKNPENNDKRKLLGQVKHSISITKKDVMFGEVIQAAWNDFNNSNVFSKHKDKIALITGALTKTDTEVVWLLNHARTTSSDRFFINIEQANFSSNIKREKLKAFRTHLANANGGSALSDNILHEFLKHFYLLGYDLGEEEGVVLSLINSHISQFDSKNPRNIWSRIREFIGTCNQHAGHIEKKSIPEDIRDLFASKVSVAEIPRYLQAKPAPVFLNQTHNVPVIQLALLCLLSGWDASNDSDKEAVEKLLGTAYDEWFMQAREVLEQPESPLSLKENVWCINNKKELFNAFASRIHDEDLERFKALALTVLTEINPAFELAQDERYAAALHGKNLKYSSIIREGIAEGLALLSYFSSSCTRCTTGKAKATADIVVHEIFQSEGWLIWGSLTNLLPILAEAAPVRFLSATESALSLSPSPFDGLFIQEGNGFSGASYISGLLWALEALAWSEQYLGQVSLILAELASKDPGGQFSNRPNNSLTDIFLPWKPHTHAAFHKRKIVVESILRDYPDVGWELLLQLFPDQHMTTSGTYQPKWLEGFEEDTETVSQKEYWEQIDNYVELAVKQAGENIEKLKVLINLLSSMPKESFKSFLSALSVPAITSLPEEEKHPLWQELMLFIRKHRHYSGAYWALTEDFLQEVERVVENLKPTQLSLIYQPLFTGYDSEFFDLDADIQEQEKQLYQRRVEAVIEIFEHEDLNAIIDIAEKIQVPRNVGYALAAIDEKSIDNSLLPAFLDATSFNKNELVRGYIWRKFYLHGWQWCSALNKDGWTKKQTGLFLSLLPFTPEVWEKVAGWLAGEDEHYWLSVDVNPFYNKENLPFVIDKLIEYARFSDATSCFFALLHSQQDIDLEKLMLVLLQLAENKQQVREIDHHSVSELIKHLQQNSSAIEDKVIQVEWAYLPLLSGSTEATPVLLERKLATEPEFFCEIIQLVFKSKKDQKSTQALSEDKQVIVRLAWRLLHNWRTVPGSLESGGFDAQSFNSWLADVKKLTRESGHLDVAMSQIGEVLIYAPTGANNLWLHEAVAEALNMQDAEIMRDGFRLGLYNSRGVHMVDPSGQSERDLAEQYRKKAEEIENATFIRLAVTLRELADGYDRDAEQVVARY